MNWQSHLQSTPKWRNMSSFFCSGALKRETCTDSHQATEKGDVTPLATISLFNPAGTCEIIFTEDLNEFHALWMTSCKDSLTSYIQQTVGADDETYHMSICVITWGKRLWLIILMGPTSRQEHIRICCWLKSHMVMFNFPYDSSNKLCLMIPCLYVTDWSYIMKKTIWYWMKFR